MTPHLFGLICGGAVLLWFLLPGIVRLMRDRARERRSRAAFAETRAANPPAPLPSPEQAADFGAWLETRRLPAAILTPADPAPTRPDGTRFGGPVWLDGDEWPQDPDGNPMEFIAQIDFAELAPLPGFPESGLLQFFIADGLNAGANAPDSGNACVLWRPHIDADGALKPPLPLDPLTSGTPFVDDRVRAGGRALVATRAAMTPTPEDWSVTEQLGPHAGAFDDDVEAAVAPSRGRHYVGGYPELVQGDFRSPTHWHDYDRVLLKLTSDAIFQWSDCGEAVFLIRRDDLLARRFDHILFHYESS